jgi:hypothetical protein
MVGTTLARRSGGTSGYLMSAKQTVLARDLAHTPVWVMHVDGGGQCWAA